MLFTFGCCFRETVENVWKKTTQQQQNTTQQQLRFPKTLKSLGKLKKENKSAVCGQTGVPSQPKPLAYALFMVTTLALLSTNCDMPVLEGG